MSKFATRRQPITEEPFPSMERFHQKTKLPTNKDVIGVMRYFTMKNHSVNQVVREVKKRVYSKWYHDSIFCHSFSIIKRRVEGIWKIYADYKKQGRETGISAKKFMELKDKADKARLEVCEEKEFGVKMSANEFKIWKT
jgi:hypothetical protein